MKIFNTHFLKYNKKIYIFNGKDPMKYFDLAKMRLHTYKPDRDPCYYKFVAGDEVGKVVRTKTKSVNGVTNKEMNKPNQYDIIQTDIGSILN